MAADNSIGLVRLRTNPSFVDAAPRPPPPGPVELVTTTAEHPVIDTPRMLEPRAPFDPALISAPRVSLDASRLATREEVTKLLLSIIELRAQGRRAALIFDVDNTLMDTRHRTVGAARSFAFEGARPLAHAAVDTVAYRPEDTCRSLGIEDPRVIGAFSEHFGDFFWSAPNLALDQPMAGTVALAGLARALGAELYFLTGRTATYREETSAQLERAGIAPETAEHLIMKSPRSNRAGLLESTERFKARELRKLHRQHVALAGFVTEGARDMRYLQDHVREVKRYVFLEFPIDGPGPPVKKARTIFLPAEIPLPSLEEVLARFRGRQV